MHSVSDKKKFIQTAFVIVTTLLLCTSCQTTKLAKYSDITGKVKSAAGDKGKSSDGSVLDNVAASGTVKDYGMTSSAHTKYTGKIVFSKKFIEFKNEKEESFTDKFLYKGISVDDVFFMAYFPRSFHNQAVKEGVKPSSGKSKLIFSFSLNGKKIDKTAEMDFNGEQFKEWTGLSHGPINTIGREPYQNLFTDSIRPLMTEYENKVKMEISFKTKIAGGKTWSPAKPMASGEFIAVMDSNMKGRLMPKPGVKLSKKLEADIKKTITSAANNYGEILRVVAPEPDWIIEHNALTGIPIKRQLRIAAAIHLKTGEYKVYFYYISQQYNGKGYSDAVFYESVANEEFNIDKNDINK